MKTEKVWRQRSRGLVGLAVVVAMFSGSLLAGSSLLRPVTGPAFAESAPPASGNITGITVGCDGTPITEVQVALSGNSDWGAVTNARGQFLFSDLAPGSYSISVEVLGYSSGGITITVSDGETTDLGRLPLGCDQVRLTDSPSVTTSDHPVETVLLVDADVGFYDCMEDVLFFDPPNTITVCPFEENLRSGGTCSSEVSAFSEGRAAIYERNPPAWTLAEGDVLATERGPRLEVPLNFWLMVPAVDEVDVADIANSHFVKAVVLFDTNRVGINFTDSVVLATDGMNFVGDSCAHLITNLEDNPTEGANWYVDGEINVYYVDQAYLWKADTERTAFGVSCGNDPNIIFVSHLSATPETLTPELGHAFGLRGGRGHTNRTLWVDHSDSLCASGGGDQDPDRSDCQPRCPSEWGSDLSTTKGCQRFTPNNIMFAGAFDPTQFARTEFTIGQAYQMNLLATSALNLNGHRTGLTWTTCGQNWWDSLPCPMLFIDP